MSFNRAVLAGAACAFLVAAAACAPKAPANANPFLGTWTVTDAKAAPWYDGVNGAVPAIDPEFMGKTIVFAEKTASGSPVVACDNAVYTITMVGPDMLFEGALKNPAADAAALGFKSDKIKTLNESCDVSTGDMELDFPMVDSDTLLLGVNSMVYTLKRAGH
jgi:hypothetical protein